MNRFQKLSLATTAMTLVLIGVGGTVRGTGSGLGCPDWPRCHGKWYPPLTFHAIIEYSHRASASIVIVLVMAVAVFAWVKYRSVASLFWPALGAVGVIAIQAFLGKLVVDSGLNSHLVVIHFATSLALLALVTTTTINSFSPRGGRFGPLARETLGVSAMTLVVAVLGAYVTQWGAALIFADWPLFDGRVIPASTSPHALIHFAHRVAALILGLGLARLYLATRGKERYRPVHILAAVAAAMWLLQALAGAANIWTRTASWAVIAHVLGGAVLWGASVAMAALAYRLTPSGAATPGEAPGTHAGTHPGMGQRVRAYFLLTKPRVIELLLITTVPAMVVAAHGWPSLALIGATLLGGSFAAGGAGAINCYVDRDIDDLMERTSGRPVPAGQIEPPRALAFGILLEILSFVFLAATVNLLSAVLAVGATIFYVFVYTIWLKRATPSNIVIGGAAGAAPVLVGWAAVTGRVGLPALVMFAIIFFWTPPHFWALSLRYTEDYAAAKVPMLPVVRGAQATARHILLYTLSLLGVSLLLYPLGSLGPIYLVSAVVLGVLFVRRALALQRNVGPVEAMRLFRFSIAHLSLLFIAMAADRLIGGPGSDVAYRIAFVAGAVLFCAFQAAILVEDLRWRGKGLARNRVLDAG
ncbi:MAG TPA: heme o synthase [Actinomycetota bacterium]|nr:heme o synthase [Actinomycetota bacterium]